MSVTNINNSQLTTLRQTPLTCSGHTRPVVFLAFSDYNEEDSANYYMISACKGKILVKVVISSIYDKLSVVTSNYFVPDFS